MQIPARARAPAWCFPRYKFCPAQARYFSLRFLRCHRASARQAPWSARWSKFSRGSLRGEALEFYRDGPRARARRKVCLWTSGRMQKDPNLYRLPASKRKFEPVTEPVPP